MERVSFKSLPKYYEKEKSGLKNNTVRYFYFPNLTDKRIELLNKFRKGEIKELEIEICLYKEVKQESFVRRVTDVSIFNDHFMYNIVTLDKEKIEELKLEKREVLVYTFISLVSGSYTAKEMAAILGIGHDGTGFNYPLVKKYCDSLVEKGLIKRNEDKFIITGGQND